MNKIGLPLLFFTTLFAFGQQPNEPGRNKGWQTDIDTLLLLMKQQHYVYKSKPLPPELLAKVAKLKTNVAKYSDERMVLELEKLMYYMHDGHSYVLPVAVKRPPSYVLPLQFYLFNDGVYIINADEPYTKLIGFRVMQINGMNIEKILDGMNSYIHQDNAFTVKWFAPTVMRFRGGYEMHGLPVSSKNITFNLIDKKNKPLHEKINFVPAEQLRGIPKLIPSQLPAAPSAPMYLSNVPANFWIEKNPDKNMLYFQFNQVEDMQDESLAAFSMRLDSTLTKIWPRLFVIDVRHNNGGNIDLLRPLIGVIKKYGTENKQAKIIVITGRNTFSAAQVFISLVNKETNALFAGEPSSSSPNFVGEEGNTFMLPWSGAIGNISNRYHESIPGDKRKWIQPDFYITLSSKLYFDNRDPVMEFIRKKFNY